ncbi:MAG: hypothetical protein ACOYL5_03045 [Phototrophicaceae bacterium]
MPVFADQYDKEPIILVRFEGEFSVNSFQVMCDLSAQYAERIPSPVLYRIIELANANAKFGDVLAVLKQVDQYQVGGIADPRIKTFFAGQDPMARLMSDMLAQKQFGGLYAPVMPGLGEALIYAEDELDKVRAGH